MLVRWLENVFVKRLCAYAYFSAGQRTVQKFEKRRGRRGEGAGESSVRMENILWKTLSFFGAHATGP